MYYAVFVSPAQMLTSSQDMAVEGDTPQMEDFIFSDIKEASAALKKYKGSRMKTFEHKEKALKFLHQPDESFLDASFSCDNSNSDLSAIFDKLSIGSGASSPGKQQCPGSPSAVLSGSPAAASSGVEAKEEEVYPSVKPALLNQLRRQIEAGDYDKVEETIWSNPRCLITVCDSAVYLMAGPKYNACHIAARANKPDVMALILDTVSNFSFMKKLYPNETDENVQDRVNHLLDSYLNTPDPRQGNTPLHFACKLGHYRVVRVLLTFEGCDINLKDSAGRTAEECILANKSDDEVDLTLKNKIKDMLKCQLHSPLYRDQLKKRLLLTKRRNKAEGNSDSDVSFSDDSFTISSPNKITSLT